MKTYKKTGEKDGFTGRDYYLETENKVIQHTVTLEQKQKQRLEVQALLDELDSEIAAIEAVRNTP